MINGLCIHNWCYYILKPGLALCNFPTDVFFLIFNILVEWWKKSQFQILTSHLDYHSHCCSVTCMNTTKTHTHTHIRLEWVLTRSNLIIQNAQYVTFSSYYSVGKLELTMHALSGSCLCFISSSNLSSSSAAAPDRSRSFPLLQRWHSCDR